MPAPVVLPWERLLWSSRPWRLARCLAGERYRLTDVRLLRASRETTDEIALADIGEVQCIERRADRVFGTSTLIVDLSPPAHSASHAFLDPARPAARRAPRGARQRSGGAARPESHSRRAGLGTEHANLPRQPGVCRLRRGAPRDRRPRHRPARQDHGGRVRRRRSDCAWRREARSGRHRAVHGART